MLPSVPSTNSFPKVYVNPNFNNFLKTQFGATEQIMYQSQSKPSELCFQQQQQVHPKIQGFTPAIHINPQFIQQKLIEQQFQLQFFDLNQKREELVLRPVEVQPALPTMQCSDRKILSKTRTRIIREPIIIKEVHQPMQKKFPSNVQTPFISITKRKLIRKHAPATNVDINQKVSIIQKQPNAASTLKSHSKYKIDRRRSRNASRSLPILKLKKPLLRRKHAFVARYALRRVTEHVVNKNISSKLRARESSTRVNKTLQLLNIGGVLYQSSPNKLQRKLLTTQTKNNALPCSTTASRRIAFSGRTLFVRGTKFVMDTKGFKLTRIPSGVTSNQQKASASTSSTKLARRRIDIGGLTYVESSKTNNIFIRTSNHVSRAHLLSAKQRSMQFLNRSLVKTNIPCPIFQRLGKCVAHKRGKCYKVHDKLQVTICQSFLRGECTKQDCLLSHNVTLAKMPVCKFYLQGLCVRDDCPYLHKKLSQKVDICVDFLRGYCELADKCNKRHEFVCPEYDRNGKCNITNCVPCQKMHLEQLRAAKKNQQKKIKKHISEKRKAAEKKVQNCSKKIDDKATAATTAAAASKQRYFVSEQNAPIILNETVINPELEKNIEIEKNHYGETDEFVNCGSTILGQRKRLGQLPSYIPLS